MSGGAEGRSSNKRVIVNVNGHKFRVPCKENQTISWLQEDVSRRYERHQKLPRNSVVVAEIRGSDGSLLDSEDCITDAVNDMEELVGVLERLSAAMQHAPHLATSMHSPAQHARPAAAWPDKGHVDSSREAEDHRSHADLYGAGEDGVEVGRGGVDEDGMLHPSNSLSAGEEELDLWACEKLRTEHVDGHEGSITCLRYDGKQLVTGGRDKLVRLWNADAESPSVTFEGHTSNVLCVDRQQNLVVSGGEPAVRVWNAQTGEMTASLEGHAHYVSCLRLSKELRLVTGSWDRTLKMWQLPRDGSETKAVESMEGHAASVLCLEVCDDRMVSGSLGGEVMMWSLLSAANTLSTFAEHGTAVNALAWERNLVFCAADKNVQVIDITVGKVVATLSGHTDSITCIVVDMPYILTGSKDSSVKVWSSRSWGCVRTISSPGVRCMGVARRTIAAGLNNGGLQWWGLA